MSADTPDAIRAHVKTYVGVFICLIFLTLVTVGVAKIEMSVPMAIFVALVVASVKGTLVAGFFMHLFDEKKIIYWVLAITVFFFLVLLVWPVLMDCEIIHYLRDLGVPQGTEAATEAAAEASGAAEAGGH